MKIAIITPSSPCDPGALAQGLEILQNWGHELLFSPGHNRPSYRYNAGTPAERSNELAWALNSGADLIMAARGGYGAHQILPEVERLLATAPKIPLLGFSDITALHQLWLRHGLPAIHGPNVTTLAKLDTASTAATRDFLDGHYREAVPERPFIGGNLAMLASLVGTPYLYRPEGNFALFLEDVGERPYRLDRLLQQLRLSGYFFGVTRVYLGEFKDCEAAIPCDYTALQVVEEFFDQLDIPHESGFPTGHGSCNHPLLLG